MNIRSWLWLLLALLFSPGMATAQNDYPASSKQSHRPLPGQIDLTNAQEMMAQRLLKLGELYQLQDRVQELLKDRQFLKQMKNFSEEDLQRLRAKVLKGEKLSEDPIWTRFLEQMKEQKNLKEWQIEVLSSWAKRDKQEMPTIESGRRMFDNAAKNAPLPPLPLPSASSSASPPLPMPDEPAPSLLDRLQEETTRWLIDNFEDLSGDMLQALSEMGNKGNAPLAELLRSVPKSDFSAINIRENPLIHTLRSGTLARYLSNAGDILHRQSGVWDKLGSLLYKAPLPSLPRVGGPSVSMRAPPTPAGDGWLPTLLPLLMLYVIVLFLFKNGLRSKMSNGSDAEWRLGSWPVAPGAVSTRQDVIRAFEYLALLCLGPSAAACHHRRLAERLAELPPHSPRSGGDGGAARRQAAVTLAWLYEQARYAPAGEDLSPEQLNDARHALCALAGVTTA